MNENAVTISTRVELSQDEHRALVMEKIQRGKPTTISGLIKEAIQIIFMEGRREN